MNQSRVEYLLKEWGRYIEKHMDWADLLGENILYRAGILSGRVQEGAAGHKILCPDSSPHVRLVDRAVRRLADGERDAIVLWYCLPAKADTGKQFTYQELGTYLGIDKEAYRKRLSRGRKNVRNHLTTV